VDSTSSPRWGKNLDVKAFSLWDGKICRATDYKWLETVVLIEFSKAEPYTVTNLKGDKEEKIGPSGR